jgi:hypothetical protein
MQQGPVARMSEAISGVLPQATAVPGVAALTRATRAHRFVRTGVPSAMSVTPFRSTIIP